MHSTLELSEQETRVGRLFMAGMPGPKLDPATQRLIEKWGLGGIILFSRNIIDPQQLAKLTNDLQKTAMKSQGIPLFLAVDQEGGRVARLREPFTPFEGNSAVGNDLQAEKMARKFGEITAMEMGLVGLNMNMAPVLDVGSEAVEKHLEGRTFGSDPAKVGHLGRIVIDSLQHNGIMAVGKHFPGLGRSPLDPHHALPTIDANAREMETRHLPPFQEAIKAGVSAIMTSHAVYPALDPDRPGTLSHIIQTDLLRNRMGFEGLIITDDLEMGAIQKGAGPAAAAVDAFEAGCDILLICENQNNVTRAMAMLRNRLLQNETLLPAFHRSVARVAAAKEKFLKNQAPVSFQKVGRYFQDHN